MKVSGPASTIREYKISDKQRPNPLPVFRFVLTSQPLKTVLLVVFEIYKD